MNDEMDYLNGEVSEPTGYTPIAPGRYLAVIGVAELVDPVAMGWEPQDDLSAGDRDDFLRPFPRLRWKIESMENGDPTDFAGRMVDQRLTFKSGVNPKTGRSFAEHRADLMRLANGLNAKDEVTGMKLVDVNTGGMDREETVRVVGEAMKKYEGLRSTIRVINYTSKKTGEKQENVGKIILPV